MIQIKEHLRKARNNVLDENVADLDVKSYPEL